MVTGTIAELSNKITFNGHKLNASQLSILTSLGFGRKIGQMEKAPNTRGKAANIWEVDNSFTASVEVTEAA